MTEATTQGAQNEPPALTQPSKLARIRMEPLDRLFVLPMTGFLSGATVGAYIGGRNAGWQYLAEKAHNLPTTTSGWYYYHKWKNYRVIFGALNKGLYYGARIGGITAFYQVTEAACDKYLFSYSCMFSSLISGFTVSLTCAKMANLTKSSFRRIVMLGAVGGLGMGAFQDSISWYESGSKPQYLDLFWTFDTN